MILRENGQRSQLNDDGQIYAQRSEMYTMDAILRMSRRLQ